jgi:uncharacterized protein YbjT (DUF2867 family)
MIEKKVLIAGATGYLGQYLVKESKKQGYWVRALTRDPKKLAHLDEYIDDLLVGEITNPDSMAGICEGIYFVISSVGITRQKDGLTYMDVDYRGNRNLLDSALKSGVSKFVYVSVLNAHLMRDLQIIQAKEKFVRELGQSNLDHTIMRPSGFFSDMLAFLQMAKKGKVNLFGTGDYRINPIHGKDLAEVCVAALGKTEKEIEVGGPEIFTFREIAELAFKVLNKDAKISTLPVWMIRIILTLMRTFTSSKTYGPVEFMMSIMTMDVVGTPYGSEELYDYFEKNVNN